MAIEGYYHLKYAIISRSHQH